MGLRASLRVEQFRFMLESEANFENLVLSHAKPSPHVAYSQWDLHAKALIFQNLLQTPT